MQWDWHTALKLAGALGGVMAIVLIIGKGYLIQETTADGVKSVSVQSNQVGALTLLRSPPLIMLFFFYVAVAIGGHGIQQFSPSALPMLFDISELEASQAVAMYIVSMTIGILVGGYVADKLWRLDLIATIGYLVSIVMMIIVALAIFPFLMVQIAFVVSGFMIGIVMPARDLMVRSVSPKGASGKAFGFVNSGFGYGAVFGPPIFGMIMDQGWIEGIYYVTAGFMAMVIVTALATSVLARSETSLQPAE
jgi:MFS family permease